MSATLALPAVDATTVHGWLATIGAVRVLAATWPQMTVHFVQTTPILTGGPATIAVAADAILTTTLHAIPPSGVLPHVDPECPPPGRDWWRHPDQPEIAYPSPWGGRDGELWQAALVSPSGLLHPLLAPHAAQTVRGMLTAPATVVRQDPTLLARALSGLGPDDRYPGGLWLLRHEVTAADSSDGQPRSAASPGRDWLALMALPWMPAIDDRTGDPAYRRCAVGWRWRRTQAGARQMVYEWWLWDTPLPCGVIPTVLTHPQYLPGQPLRCGAWCPPRGPHDPRMVASFRPDEIAAGVLDDAGSLITAVEVAEMLGLGGPDADPRSVAGSARRELSRMGISAVRRQPGRGGASLYDLAQVRAAIAQRPGRGARTDRRAAMDAENQGASLRSLLGAAIREANVAVDNHGNVSLYANGRTLRVVNHGIQEGHGGTVWWELVYDDGTTGGLLDTQRAAWHATDWFGDEPQRP